LLSAAVSPFLARHSPRQCPIPPDRPRVPGYRRHSSGQARVTLDCKDFLLGPYGSEESKEAYRRTIAEWAERKGPFPPKADTPPLSVNDAGRTPTATGKAGAEEGQSSSPRAVSSTA
jgi:hypothetical protein